jgi:uncharacterized protein
MLQVSELFIYPVKSLGGISLSKANVTDRGFEYDRRWMLVNEQGEFMTQRTLPQLALFRTSIEADHLSITHKLENMSISVPFEAAAETRTVDVWSDRCRARLVDAKIDQWFSDLLSLKCSLIYMPDTTKRRVDGRYAQNKEITSFSDAYPFLIISQASLDDINNRITEQLPMNRFRPNIVVTGSMPFEEDEWAHFAINEIDFYGVKLCARCVMTTINQDNATQAKEPLKTLSTYRLKDKKVFFGQNLLHKGEGVVSIGDEVTVLERKKARLPQI